MRTEDRIKKLRHLKAGWMANNSGVPINDALIKFLLTSLKTNRDAFNCLKKADIFPTIDGFIELEWHTDLISTYLTFRARYADYEEFDHTDGQEYKEIMDTQAHNFWSSLSEKVLFNIEYEG